MSESAAALVRTIAAVARPDARPPEDQVRALEELLEHRRRVKRAHLVWTAAAAAKRFGALTFQNASIRGSYAHDGW